MYATCPECRHRRQPQDSGPEGICPRCGLVFAKWLKRRLAPEEPPIELSPRRRGRLGELAREWLFRFEPVDEMTWYGRLAAFVLLSIWGLYFVLLEMETNAIGNSFLHGVNLLFHEAGHVIFIPFGWFMTVLGGSLFQIMVPLMVCGSFLWRHNPFGASIGLMWTGQSLMDVAPYINDARALELPLVGGGTGADRPGAHDWENLLGHMGLLQRDHAIASAVDTVGELVVLLAIAWGGYVLYLQHRSRRC